MIINASTISHGFIRLAWKMVAGPLVVSVGGMEVRGNQSTWGMLVYDFFGNLSMMVKHLLDEDD